MQTQGSSENNTVIVARDKVLPLLGALVFRPSKLWWRFELAAYSLLAVSASAALWPYLPVYPVLYVWFCVFFFILVSAAIARFDKHRSGTLEYSNDGWLVAFNGEAALHVMLKNRVLIWQHLVILTFVDRCSHKKLYLVIGSDSIDASDFSRLRRWLITVLTPAA